MLRTNIRDWSVEQLWRTYVQLSEAEAAFRIHKSELSLRPIWHQREDRVQAHILVCFLAYVLWKTLEQWQSRAGLGNSPRTILDELGRVQSADVVLRRPKIPAANCASAAWSDPIRRKPCCSTGSGLGFPNVSDRHRFTTRRASKCSADFQRKVLNILDSTPRTVELGLGQFET